MVEVLEKQSKPISNSKTTQILKQIWDKSNEELFNDCDTCYANIKEINKQNVINEKSLNENIKTLILSQEQLWKNGQLPYNQNDICRKITERLADCQKSIRVTVARLCDPRFKRKYDNDPESSNVAPATISSVSNEDAQSKTIFDEAKEKLNFIKENFKYLTPSDMQDLHGILDNVKNKSDKYCKENNIQTVETETFESNLDRTRKEAKGDPISCPTPDGVEQQNIKTDTKTTQQIIDSLRTGLAKSIFKYGLAWCEVALAADNYPATLPGDSEKLEIAFDSHREFLEDATDIKCKRDHSQWAQIVDIYHNISKHNAAANEILNVYGVSCSNCGARMKPIEKKRDVHRLYWRCPNYYNTEPEYDKCKSDSPVLRNVSKERITEVHPYIIRWCVNVWNTLPNMMDFIYWFRNYKQPYHTEHTKSLEWKFQRRGV